VTSVQDSIAQGMTYCYRVDAFNSTSASGFTNLVLVTNAMLPVAPDGLSAVAASSREIDLTWPAVSGASGYLIERSMDGLSGWTQVGSSTGTGFANVGLTGATTYYYRVCAVNSAGTSPPSSIASATTMVVPPLTMPLAPSNLTVTAISKNKLRLTWTDNSSNESGFYVDRSTDGRTWSRLATLAANTATYTNGGVKRGTVYYYRVLAYNSSGTSAASNIAAATVPASASQTPDQTTPQIANPLISSAFWQEPIGGSFDAGRKAGEAAEVDVFASLLDSL